MALALLPNLGNDRVGSKMKWKALIGIAVAAHALIGIAVAAHGHALPVAGVLIFQGLIRNSF